MSGRNPANNILIYIGCESQVDLIGDLRTSPTGISLFHIDDRADDFPRRPLWSGFGSALWRKQEPILPFNKGVMKAEERRWFESDRNFRPSIRRDPK